VQGQIPKARPQAQSQPPVEPPVTLSFRQPMSSERYFQPQPSADAAHHPDTEARRLAELLDMAQEFGRIGVWERDIPTGNGRWDRHVFRFFDMDPADGTPSYEAAALRIHPDDRDTVAYLESTRQPGLYEKRYRVLRRDGGVRVLHSHWRVIADAHGKPVRTIGIMVDDTETHELASSLGDAHARLALVADVAAIGTWRHDLRTNLMHYDEHAWRILGLPPRTSGWPLDEVRRRIHPDDLPAVTASARRTFSDGRPTDVEARYLHADGTWRYIMTRRSLERDASGTPVAFVGVGLDVTDRKRTELALQLANERVALAAHGAGIGTWERDLVTGEVFWDAQMFVLRGLQPRAQAPSEHEWLSIAHPDDRDRVQAALAHSIATGEPSTYDFRIRRPDGQWRWLASRTLPVRAADGIVVRQTGVNWDVTDARQSELERQERIAAQRESRAKSQFLARMSHELRTPLNAVLGFTQLMLDEARLDAVQHERLKHVTDAGEHLLSLINDVLDLSRLQSGDMRLALEPVPLEDALRETLPLVEHEARARGIAITLGALDAVVRADPTRLRQVLLNLLSNAIKYNRDGGRVQVEAAADGTHVDLSVRDTGRGMDAAQLTHLFEPFNRLGLEREGIEGTGVGLAIAKSLVDAMGGEMTARSEPGVGSDFVVRLLDARHAQQAARPRTAAAAVPARYQGKVVYVEDNTVNVLIVRELVTRCPGLEFASAPDGEQGVRRTVEMRPDLVLVDMQLPDFDGHEVLRRLRADPRTAAIPCIALSANAMPEDIQRARAAGFDDYWTKPIDLPAFMAAMAARFGQA
jgi:PAS domain S-box-containing protein